MIMQAVVIEVQRERLLVFDLETRQRVIVNTPNARRFRPGDLVLIWYNGVMTRSIPPQINAISIRIASPEDFPPFERPPVQRPPVVFPPIVLPPIVRPPVIRPPVIQPPVVRPPVVRPPAGRPPNPRPPSGRPPNPGPGPGPRPR